MILILGGSDGVGKSYIIDDFVKYKPNYKKKWFRHPQYFSGIFNLIMKIFGYNYTKIEDGIKIGYHDYDNFFCKIIYIPLRTIDIYLHFIFNILKLRLSFKKNFVVDRFHIDSIIDMLVDTKTNNAFVISLFRPLNFIVNLFSTYIIILKDDSLEIKNDVKVDKNRHSRKNYYYLIIKKYNLKTFINSNLYSYEKFQKYTNC
tara:strand:- start:833 stop:1438 length:606 start_codon:yes stop_codon:yes gene_type:complete